MHGEQNGSTQQKCTRRTIQHRTVEVHVAMFQNDIDYLAQSLLFYVVYEAYLLYLVLSFLLERKVLCHYLIVKSNKSNKRFFSCVFAFVYYFPSILNCVDQLVIEQLKQYLLKVFFLHCSKMCDPIWKILDRIYVEYNHKHRRQV